MDEEYRVDPHLIQELDEGLPKAYADVLLEGLDNIIEKPTELTGRQIVRLAAVLPADKMSLIAEGFMGIEYEILQDLQKRNRDNAEAFKRDIIKLWIEKNRKNQLQVIREILFTPDSDGSFVRQ